MIDANQQSLAAVGHWGVPTIEYNSEPFFGHDRVEAQATIGALGVDAVEEQHVKMNGATA